MSFAYSTSPAQRFSVIGRKSGISVISQLRDMGIPRLVESRGVLFMLEDFTPIEPVFKPLSALFGTTVSYSLPASISSDAGEINAKVHPKESPYSVNQAFKFVTFGKKSGLSLLDKINKEQTPKPQAISAKSPSQPYHKMIHIIPLCAIVELYYSSMPFWDRYDQACVSISSEDELEGLEYDGGEEEFKIEMEIEEVEEVFHRVQGWLDEIVDSEEVGTFDDEYTY